MSFGDNRWTNTLAELAAARVTGQVMLDRGGPGRVAQADQAQQAISDLIRIRGVDVCDPDELLAVAAGVSLNRGLAEQGHPDGDYATAALICLGQMLRACRRRWILTYDERPWTSNAQSSRRAFQGHVRLWRGAFRLLAIQQRIPKLERISVEVQPVLHTGRWMQDASACHPAAKAAIDGLVDAGVIPDDRPPYVHAVTYLEPRVDRARRRDAMELTVNELPTENAL